MYLVICCNCLGLPQRRATCKYIAKEPDELSLEEGDVVFIIKKHVDGLWWLIALKILYQLHNA